MIKKHQLIAILLFVVIVSYTTARNGLVQSLERIVYLLWALIPVLFYRLIAFFSGMGFWESKASDYGSVNSPVPYALFFWILYIIVCCYVVFEWRV